MIFVFAIAALITAILSHRARRMAWAISWFAGQMHFIGCHQVKRLALPKSCSSQVRTKLVQNLGRVGFSCQEASEGQFMADLAVQFRDEQKRLGLSASQIAEFFDIDRTVVQRVESGLVLPDAKLVQALRGLSSTQVKESVAPNVQSSETALNPSVAERDRSRQKSLGQFFTPREIASFMVSLFSPSRANGRLLDAGAGKGSLTSAFAEGWFAKQSEHSLAAELYEIDETVIPELISNLTTSTGLSFKICREDFLEAASRPFLLGAGASFTHAILNPPYKKIPTNSSARKHTRAVGFESVNLYACFVGAALHLLEDGGELVAIIPRSFCNGPYYLDFRRYILANASLEHIHVFKRRDSAFSKDAVLQENIIVKLRKGNVQNRVTISNSTDEKMTDFSVTDVEFDQVIHPGDHDYFFHLAIAKISTSPKISIEWSLSELGVKCSTGPLVDFRVRGSLLPKLEDLSAPLLYPHHLSKRRLEWPKPASKKANAVRLDVETLKAAWPKGYYVAIRRFSSKEEKRRVFASVVEPNLLPGNLVVFENHLNVLHSNKKPLPRELAWGLCAYLNCNHVDESIRSFSGHTQVNAADLRKLKFPNSEQLVKLGKWYENADHEDQAELDKQVEGLSI
jgi:adenine-specific DNA-methyltransferase